MQGFSRTPAGHGLARDLHRQKEKEEGCALGTPPETSPAVTLLPPLSFFGLVWKAPWWRFFILCITRSIDRFAFDNNIVEVLLLAHEYGPLFDELKYGEKPDDDICPFLSVCQLFE